MKILILYYIPNNSIKYNKWHDGFTKAIDILRSINIFEIDKINFYDNNNNIELNNYKIVLIKWGFGSKMQIYAQNYFKEKGKKCLIGIFVSNINKPSNNDIKFFDIIFYETEWYRKYANLNRHSNIYHAFGIDNNIMTNLFLDKIYDYIFVGNITSYKRPLNLINKNGSKLVVGFLEDKTIINELKLNNVKVLDYVEYNELAKLYNQSKICYIPCKLNGGGERAVLEARSCGLKVEIENDNPKLLELLKSDIYDANYYANQIKKGIFNVINNGFKNSIDLYKFYSNSNINIVQIGSMDGKTFDNLHLHIINNHKVKAYLIEPVKYYFDKLVKNYSNGFGHYILLNNAISNIDGDIDFYIIEPDEIKKNKLPKFLMGISSIYNNKNALSKEYWLTRGKLLAYKNKWTFENLIEKYIKKIKVNSISVQTLLNNYNINIIDILIIDAGGNELNIIKDFLNIIKPIYIKFEYNNLFNIELEECKKILLFNNYKMLFLNSHECLATFLN